MIWLIILGIYILILIGWFTYKICMLNPNEKEE
jgi:hypothetical protein